jgi:CubicO group peptidase (beta-lactamase class C family)
MITTRRNFLAQLSLATAGLSLLSRCPNSLAASVASLPRSTPEAQGISSQAILDFLDGIAAKHIEVHGFVLVRHGHVVAEGWWRPYAATLNHTLYSMSKSFTSTAVGLAAAEGRLSVDDPVVSFFPEFLPSEVSDNLKALKIKDMLCMAVGHAQDSTGSMVSQDNWVKAFLALPVPNTPGTHFVYNSGATYMCSAIVQKVTGQKIIDYLTPRLFTPLGITGMTWETCPRGINTGGWGLSVPTEALAKFGQLYLQKGLWNGKQIIPAKWVEEATRFKIQQPLPADNPKAKDESDWLQGYCYQFWRSRHNAFRGDGAFGQYTIVMPEQDAVLAVHCETGDMQGEQNLLWDILLPAMGSQPLPKNNALNQRLKQKLESLTLPPLQGPDASPLTAGVTDRTYKLAANPKGVQSISIDFKDKDCIVQWTDARGTHTLRSGLGRWSQGDTTFAPPTLVVTDKVKAPDHSKYTGSAIWKTDNTLELRWQFIETPHHDRVTCQFDGNKIKVALKTSLGESWPELTGEQIA